MTLHRGRPTITLEMRTNLFLGRVEIARELLGLLEQYGGVFLPEEFDVGTKSERWLPYRENRERALSELTKSDHPGVVARQRGPIKVDYVIDSSRSWMFDHVSIFVDGRWASEPNNLKTLLEFAKNLYGVIEASSGYIQNDLHETRYDRAESQTEGGGLRNEPRFPGSKNHLPGLFWANYFGPEYVDMWGKSFLHRISYVRIEDLPDGGIVLILSASPLEAQESWYPARKAELYAYLGYDAFDGRKLPRFRIDGPWRKKRHARPLVETGGVLDDVFATDNSGVHSLGIHKGPSSRVE